MSSFLAPLIGLLVVGLLFATVSRQARATERGFIVQYGKPFKILAIVSAALTLIFVCAYFFTSGENRFGVLLLVVMFAVISVPLLLMVFKTRFEVEDRTLVVQSPWRATRRIPLDAVESVQLVESRQRYEFRTKGHGQINLHRYLSGLEELIQLVSSEVYGRMAKAAEVMVAQRDASENELAEKLTAALGDEDLADRLLEFLPLAFSRVVLVKKGVILQERFIRAIDDQNFSVPCPLDLEPIWGPSREFAAWASAQMPEEDFLAIARRSSEFDAFNKALLAGSDPKNLVGSAPLFTRVAPLPAGAPSGIMP